MSINPSVSQTDLDYMAEAIACVDRATHRVSPNPMVGCVIVKDGVIIGTGVTEPPGQRHAEIVALDEAGENARGADMYVTLEPCCHTGRTAPCTEAIIRAGMRRVFVGVIDPNPVVHGKGLNQLKNAGIETVVGVLADAAKISLRHLGAIFCNIGLAILNCHYLRRANCDTYSDLNDYRGCSPSRRPPPESPGRRHFDRWRNRSPDDPNSLYATCSVTRSSSRFGYDGQYSNHRACVMLIPLFHGAVPRKNG